MAYSVSRLSVRPRRRTRVGNPMADDGQMMEDEEEEGFHPSAAAAGAVNRTELMKCSCGEGYALVPAKSGNRVSPIQRVIVNAYVYKCKKVRVSKEFTRE